MSNKRRVAAIHQPNFLPWLGYFDKIAKCDVFVILDHVVNNPRTAIITKRVQILCNRQPYWLTVPLKHPTGTDFLVPINRMVINNNERFKEKHIKTIELNYKKHPFYDEVRPLLNHFYGSGSDLLAERNVAFIKAVCRQLRINREFVHSSDLNCTSSSTEMLAEISQAVGANVYIHGKGAEGYQDNSILENHGIEPLPQAFVHPKYSQINSGDFVEGLSVIDALMNCGIEGTRRMLLAVSTAISEW
jgi:hypothetical protein